MLTLLPYVDYNETARCLRNIDLQNQLAQVVIALDTLHEIDEVTANAWRMHPITDMWKNHELQLCEYGQAMCDEWQRRGKTDESVRLYERIQFHVECITCVEDFEMSKPPWMLDGRFYYLRRSHRSYLMGKDPKYYARFSWGVPTGLPIYWPKASEKQWKPE